MENNAKAYKNTVERDIVAVTNYVVSTLKENLESNREIVL